MRSFASCCKINLFLKIGAKQASGLHELCSLFLPLNIPHDLMFFKPEDGNSLKISCNAPELCGEDNVIFRAWREYGKKTAWQPGLEISLEKNIPSGAGLGGGSSNAALALLWLNGNSPNPLCREALLETALAVGSDVPFFIDRKAALVSGTGEIVRELALPPCEFFIVLVWPEIAVSTKWAFQALDKMRGGGEHEKDLTKSICPTTSLFFADQKWKNIFRCFGNDLEEPVFAEWPELSNIRNFFLEQGALYAAMSGSGSTIFGIFDNKKLAGRAMAALEKDFGHVYLNVYKSTGV